MCFDEATSSLDTKTEQNIQSAINIASKDVTTIIIAHRLSTVVNCDNIIVLKLGQIVEAGSHNSLISMNSGLYKSMWEQQTEDSKIEQLKLQRENSMKIERELFEKQNTE